MRGFKIVFDLTFFAFVKIIANLAKYSTSFLWIFGKSRDFLYRRYVAINLTVDIRVVIDERVLTNVMCALSTL